MADASTAARDIGFWGCNTRWVVGVAFVYINSFNIHKKTRLISQLGNYQL